MRGSSESMCSLASSTVQAAPSVTRSTGTMTHPGAARVEGVAHAGVFQMFGKRHEDEAVRASRAHVPHHRGNHGNPVNRNQRLWLRIARNSEATSPTGNRKDDVEHDGVWLTRLGVKPSLETLDFLWCAKAVHLRGVDRKDADAFAAENQFVVDRRDVELAAE